MANQDDGQYRIMRCTLNPSTQWKAKNAAPAPAPAPTPAPRVEKAVPAPPAQPTRAPLAPQSAPVANTVQTAPAATSDTMRALLSKECDKLRGSQRFEANRGGLSRACGGHLAGSSLMVAGEDVRPVSRSAAYRQNACSTEEWSAFRQPAGGNRPSVQRGVNIITMSQDKVEPRPSSRATPRHLTSTALW